MTLLSTVNLAQGVATYSTSTLTAGAHSITAVYSGDSNFATITSSAVTETVNDFTLNVSNNSSPSATVTPGGTATYTLAIGPSAGTTFPGPVTLSLSGLPPGATGTLSPTTLPAGSSLSNVTLTIQLPQQTAFLLHRNLTAAGLLPIFGMLLLPFGRKFLQTDGKRRYSALLLVLLLVTMSVAGLAGCGAQNTGFLGQQNFTLTVTATSGSLSHSTTLTLIVQ